MVWYLECTPAITSHLQNGSALAFLHLLNTILGLWIFNFVTECEWFGFCRWTSPCVRIFAPWIYFLCPDTRQETYLICRTGLRHLLVGYLFVTLHSQCFFFNVHDFIKEWLVLFFLFPTLSLFLLTGLLRCWVCVCCFVLSGCYVVMLCVKRNKKKCWSQKKREKKKSIFISNLLTIYTW